MHKWMASPLLAVFALTGLLVGCGGGGGDEPSSQMTSAQRGDTLVPLALAGAVPMAASSPTTAASATVWALNGSATQWMARQQGDSLSDQRNVAVVTPLGQAHLMNLTRAAQGDTLAEIQLAITKQSLTALSQAGLPGVERQAWSTIGHLFRQAFLDEILLSAPGTPLAAWQAAETSFVHAFGAGHASLESTLSATGLSAAWSGITQHERVTFLQIDQFTLSVSLVGGSVEQVRFVGEATSPSVLSAVVWREGVKQVVASTHTAQHLQAGQHIVLTITPASGTLGSWTADQVSAAIRNTVDTVAAGGASDGALTLIQGKHVLAVSMRELLRGLQRPFSSIQADMRGLDLRGGTYLADLAPQATVSVTADALSLASAMGQAYVYEPRNVNQGSGIHGSMWTIADRPEHTYASCPAGVNTVRPAFVAVLDSQHRIVLLTALRTPSAETYFRCWWDSTSEPVNGG